LKAALGELARARQGGKHRRRGFRELGERFQQTSGRGEPVNHFGVRQGRNRQLESRFDFPTKMAEAERFFGLPALAVGSAATRWGRGLGFHLCLILASWRGRHDELRLC
jgi:hypothetical protein